MSGTRQKTLGEQLSQTWVAEGRGEALDAEAEDAEPLMAKPAPESPALAEQLMEEVCDRENLERAWKRVRSNKGSPGVDGMTIDAAKDYLREHWPNIRAQLLEGTYQPQPVKRVEIPKPDGGIRKLGVPCVVDRLIQQAMLQVLQERWDPTFSEYSYGFRPGRSAHHAVAQAQRYIADGYNVVVDLDLEKFFDRVNHDSLMARVAARVSDKRVLKLIRSPLVHQRGSGACPDIRRSSKPYATPISSRSVFPKSVRPPKPNSVEPPWYGTRMPGGVGGVASRGVPLSRSIHIRVTLSRTGYNIT